MSHVREKEELLNLKKYIVKLGNSVDTKTIDEALNFLVPKNDFNKNMIGINVSNGNRFNNGIPGYIPSANTIILSRDGFIKISNESAKIICDTFDYKNTEEMATYYQTFSLLHEVEHGYQFLTAYDRIPFKYQEVKDSYKGIIESINPKKEIIQHPIKELRGHISFFKYQKNAYDFVLERNAEVEAAFDTSILAKESGNEKIAEIFEKLGLAFLNIGYEENNKGCVYQTYKGLLREKEYDKIIKDPTMDEETRLRFGLDVNEETRRKLIKKIEKNRIKI